MDSHAENDKGGSENEGEIGEKLNRGHYENFNGTVLVVGTAMVANAQIQTLSMPIRERNQQGRKLIQKNLPLTLQFISYMASKPANIRIMAMRAERRQLEYSFGPVYDQVAARV